MRSAVGGFRNILKAHSAKRFKVVNERLRKHVKDMMGKSRGEIVLQF